MSNHRNPFSYGGAQGRRAVHVPAPTVTDQEPEAEVAEEPELIEAEYVRYELVRLRVRTSAGVFVTLALDLDEAELLRDLLTRALEARHGG